jgi:hypothetical protein|tara:strand:+ start:4456 stop:4668 length:213 start_codon:yes stop_codon:yes gene_type:complete
MAWADWMVVKQTLTEELSLERQIRSINSTKDLHTLQQLCSALTRQNWHYSKLLKQAVGRVAELDVQRICD